MNFKDIEFTADEFAALQTAYSGFLANQEKSPEYIFRKTSSPPFTTLPAHRCSTLRSSTKLRASRQSK